ncbi:hypothetical protein [Desulfosarcina ovata]|uniref:Uncharacterized protein n=2 Tax=Desulfosarcina ovata TaxID=83564 RepID=A0A5K8AFC2_9BACT|nr:hypothetical protein [Desulfosarcina ovata]BBO84723.1 hypothetical protein DSCO28_52890 [Desulfosarcina ovata subsp. sediminis]BBO91216.1 hypothetical protein DSCOOX_43960 [Desulfosarcina ovata subsp. ovata]
MRPHTCVSPEGRFVYGIHQPHFTARNFRATDQRSALGTLADGTHHLNEANFPAGSVHEPSATPIYEIPNAFPFRGTTYIGKGWADARARNPEAIRLPRPPEVSFFKIHPDEPSARKAIAGLPRPLQLALAATSTDARDLCALAHLATAFCMDTQSHLPWGLEYEQRADGRIKARIADEALFEAVANNVHLPDAYKQAMVLRPGAQGNSEIVGEWHPQKESHVFEYLRRNSYIPWGHYAANMANDAVRYQALTITPADMAGMRHLYYQRTYTRLAEMLSLPAVPDRRPLTETELESLRQRIQGQLAKTAGLDVNRTLWGWNYGFDYAPSGYRLHASHQQIHQQYALIPATVPLADGAGHLPAYACGDRVADFVRAFRRETGKGFFECYMQAIGENRRTDGNPRGERRLVVFEDDRVILFVPKAQTSQWELQLMPKTAVGNVTEADTATRHALDRAILVAVKVLAGMGARMITTIEYSKAIDDPGTDQRLLMAFMPRLPESPGAFSEAQLRWINGHYPEDFALACRCHLPMEAKTGDPANQPGAGERD